MNISINNNFSLTTANDICNICKPLEKLGINYFTYLSNFKDGSQIYLSTSARWISDYYNLKLYESSLFERNPSSYPSGYMIWPKEDNSKVFIHGRDYFDSGNGITRIIASENKCEFFFFSGSTKSTWLNNFYLNNIDLLEKFIAYFKDSASRLIKKAEKNRIQIHLDTHTQKNELIDSSILQLSQFDVHARTQFLTEINLQEGITPIVKLSPREQQVAFNILKGWSAPKIAEHLIISRKTVERHIENIKSKMKCSNKSQLIKNLLQIKL